MDSYRIPTKSGASEYVDKRSRFLGLVRPVGSEDEARTIIAACKKQYHDARHNCWCYLLRDGTERYSDDGEPQGTAGIPMLEVFRRAGVTNVVCVVTRYFGGVLLGANGLVRAYSHSTALAIENAQVKVMLPCYPVSIQTDYALYGKIAYHLPQEDILQLDTIFEDQVELKLLVRDSLWEPLKKELIELTSGQVEIVSGGLQYADFSKAKK